LTAEISKIKYYFDEGERLWATDPERVISKDFYELWENIQRPRPFPINTPELNLLEHSFELFEEPAEKIAYFSWDPDEDCAVLKIEGNESEEKFLLTFNDGTPQIYETPVKLLDQGELEHGERLEIIYDVIAFIKKQKPGKDVLAMTKQEYLFALNALKGRHEDSALKVMKQLKADFMKSLLKKAAEDMALDELSHQLSLPLDGSYASSNLETQTEKTQEISSGGFFIHSRTPWQNLQLLELLSTAYRLNAEAEKAFILNFSEATLLSNETYGDTPLKVPAHPEMPLREGQLLSVFQRGDNEPIGTFMIDMFDGNVIYGRLRTGLNFDITRDRLFAKPPQSPLTFLADSLEYLFKSFETGNEIPGAINPVIGFADAVCNETCKQKTPEALSSLQAKAWSCSINSNNDITLVQGPPGTGKTSVLEQIIRQLCLQGKKILVTAPSNTAVDNICRRIFDLPLLRLGNKQESIAPDVAENCWIKNDKNIFKFTERREHFSGGLVYAGTQVGLMRNKLIHDDIENNGLYDVIIFDEAGMTALGEFALCLRLAKRTILFGDHQQLPPFPMPQAVIDELYRQYKYLPENFKKTLNSSALEWLVENRNLPVIMLKRSFRCQNPRLLRFSSTLFYNAGIKTSEQAEYYRLSYEERQQKYPQSSLRLYQTSSLPAAEKNEKLVFEGRKPGLENFTEAVICAKVFYDALEKYPLEEISIIAPYRRQVRLLRNLLSHKRASEIIGKAEISESDWLNFIHTRIATVDSFQGGESDMVIICYVRSNQDQGIGFVDDPNRINVAHTRSRKEMAIVGDMECLIQQSGNKIFARMKRAFDRDGEIINTNIDFLEQIRQQFPELKNHPRSQ
jgi:GTPase SAR1 family protein